ncbi:MAG: PIG-L family deacetylase [Acidimicrobiia bacterium]|nr:PIG-L family deacetylase [Acidimicrobiia bacterium]
MSAGTPVAGLEGVTSVLAVAAHPDDLDFGCAATLARFVDAGAGVTELIATRGDAGSSDPGMTRERLREIRTREAESAAAVLGAELVLLDHTDGEVVDGIDLRREVSRSIRALRPDVLVVLDPSPLIGDAFINHPDHRAVAQAALDSVITGASTRLIFPELLDEGLEPHKPATILMMRPRVESGFVVDVTTTIDRKVEALRAHVSQVGERDVATMVREWARRVGEAHGMAYAEGFHRIDVMN